MIKSPIQTVTNKFQNRAIGIVNGIYIPEESKLLNRGTLVDEKGHKLQTVVLVSPLINKKYINLEKKHLWIVYPKNKSTQSLLTNCRYMGSL